MPLWFKETNATKLRAHCENKWVKFFRIPGDRKKDGRKLLQKCNHYCNRPAVLWISHNLTIWVNTMMFSLVVSTCTCTFQEDQQSCSTVERPEPLLYMRADLTFQENGPYLRDYGGIFYPQWPHLSLFKSLLIFCMETPIAFNYNNDLFI